MQLFHLSQNRILKVCSIQEFERTSLDEPFVVFQVAESDEELQEAEAIAKRLITLGCVHFCCAGTKADKLEDLIDYLIEELSLKNPDYLNILTVSISNLEEACEYFIWVAGSASPILIALENRNLNLGELIGAELLKSEID